jgi:hypothetical protein
MKSLTGVVAAMLALTLGVANAVFAADAPAGTPAAARAKQALEEGCKENEGMWASRGRQGGICTVTQDPAAKKQEKQTLEQWCKAHGGTWTSDGHQGGSCSLRSDGFDAGRGHGSGG